MSETEIETETQTQSADADELGKVVQRLSRRAAHGGRVIERAAILAEGSRSGPILAWLEEQGWTPEEAVTRRRGSAGLHGAREQEAGAARNPARYVSAPSAE